MIPTKGHPPPLPSRPHPVQLLRPPLSPRTQRILRDRAGAVGQPGAPLHRRRPQASRNHPRHHQKPAARPRVPEPRQKAGKIAAAGAGMCGLPSVYRGEGPRPELGSAAMPSTRSAWIGGWTLAGSAAHCAGRLSRAR
ncbi:hypothetical protein KSP39_PZI013073 [Platanthera zijinensis]|uniref:Uncharacterized protein n=1 Tax=Platanthera zijinensis TaxID=2320716 RepID=A0AAP0BDN4_9ASPA